ncbi:hypothetical protein [Streptomyces sp. CL12-4]|uniref:hypothetical protein n=1 Tax=Streptomyces sp. CL12-4 TaxID=2810306 RepID=UPI001EFAF57A|nr:hypothetical protein [Streptomyces sp. CL12-4]MCG8971390.1 hypothetical protein [Streptomyces sp. CL12-4]
MTNRYRVTVAIDGRQMLRGWWQDESVARRKFTGWVGEHGARPHVLITLTDEETGATLTQWPDNE